MAGDKESAIKAGCTGYIEKPINLGTFMAEIEKYIWSSFYDKKEGSWTFNCVYI